MRYLFMMAPQIMRALHNIRRPQQRYCLLNGTAAAQAGQGFFIPGVPHKAANGQPRQQRGQQRGQQQAYFQQRIAYAFFN